MQVSHLGGTLNTSSHIKQSSNPMHLTLFLHFIGQSVIKKIEIIIL
jgi:hypothetical protein